MVSETGSDLAPVILGRCHAVPIWYRVDLVALGLFPSCGKNGGRRHGLAFGFQVRRDHFKLLGRNGRDQPSPCSVFLVNAKLGKRGSVGKSRSSFGTGFSPARSRRTGSLRQFVEET